MKQFLIALGLLFTLSAQADILVHEETIRLDTDADCKHRKILNYVMPRMPQPWFAGTGKFQDKVFQACWTKDGAGNVVVVFEDFDVHMYPMTALRTEKKI